VNPEIAARLASLDIQLVGEANAHFMLVRESCVALVRRIPEGGFSLGSAGMMTAGGLAYLVWRDGQPLLVGKGREVAAGAGEMDSIRKFSEDLKSALDAPGSE
jgi:hypothetical protein